MVCSRIRRLFGNPIAEKTDHYERNKTKPVVNAQNANIKQSWCFYFIFIANSYGRFKLIDFLN